MAETTDTKTPAVQLKDGEAIARRAAEICENAKAEEVVVYDVRKNSMLADFYIVVSGSSEPHLRALAKHLEKGLIENGVKCRGLSGTAESRWMIADFGDVLVHIFHPDLREFYKIDELFAANPILTLAKPEPVARPKPAARARK